MLGVARHTYDIDCERGAECRDEIGAISSSTDKASGVELPRTERDECRKSEDINTL
jgi:hypothetical protein